MLSKIMDTPWKLVNGLLSWFITPFVKIRFLASGIARGKNWRFHGCPILQKHRQSEMRLGNHLDLRSTVRANPLGANHPVVLCTWAAGARLEIGDHFGMTGGVICCAERITIGDHVAVGANTTITDTDFHPLDPQQRLHHPQAAQTAPITIEDYVFIGMNCLILKGVTIGEGSVVGAGSVVAKDVPPYSIVAGNPARVIKSQPH